MYTLKQIVLLLTSIGLTLGFSVQAGELTQGFVNPDFGGNPNNGGYLLSNATAINQHNAPITTASSNSPSSSTPLTTGQQFAQQLDRLVMSALANRLVTKAFGIDSTTLPTKSTFDTGVNTVTVEDTGNGTRVTIVDDATGGQTVLDIPNY